MPGRVKEVGDALEVVEDAIECVKDTTEGLRTPRSASTTPLRAPNTQRRTTLSRLDGGKLPDKETRIQNTGMRHIILNLNTIAPTAKSSRHS